MPSRTRRNSLSYPNSSSGGDKNAPNRKRIGSSTSLGKRSMKSSRRVSSNEVKLSPSGVSLWALRFFWGIVGLLCCLLAASICLALRELLPQRVQSFLGIYIQPFVVYGVTRLEHLWMEISPYLTEVWRVASTTDIKEVRIFAKKIGSEYPTELAAAFLFLSTLLSLLLLSRFKHRTTKRKTSAGTTVAFGGRHYGALNSEEEEMIEISSSEEEDLSEEENSTTDLVGEDCLYVERPLSAEEFRKQGEEHTLKELTSLYRTPEFRSLVKNRGNDDRQYNWQKRRTARDVKSR